MKKIDPLAPICPYCHRQMREASNPLSSVWRNMMRRCTDRNAIDYKHYGGRGITVCDRWRKSFWAFAEDMGPKPSPDYSLDRIDNNGSYTPENCRWADQVAQHVNRRTTYHLAFKGETHTIREWAELTGQTERSLRARILRLHWPLEVALTTPPKRQPSSMHVAQRRHRDSS